MRWTEHLRSLRGGLGRDRAGALLALPAVVLLFAGVVGLAGEAWQQRTVDLLLARIIHEARS